MGTRTESSLRRLPHALLAASALAFAALAACSAPDPRTTPATAQPIVAPAFADQVRTLEAGSRPGTMHRRLDGLIGDWDVALADVDPTQAETVVARGAARLEWVHGGRYVLWSATLEHAGTTSGFLGYDLRGSRYQLSMVSSLSSGMGVADGYGDPRGSGIRFTLENYDPSSGQRVRLVSLLRSIDANHFVLESLGAEDRVVRRTHYLRKPAAR